MKKEWVISVLPAISDIKRDYDYIISELSKHNIEVKNSSRDTGLIETTNFMIHLTKNPDSAVISYLMVGATSEDYEYFKIFDPCNIMSNLMRMASKNIIKKSVWNFLNHEKIRSCMVNKKTLIDYITHKERPIWETFNNESTNMEDVENE